MSSHTTSSGSSGNDTIHGTPGNDNLNGRAGNDLIYGYAGSDRLYGETGNDRLYGGTGNDPHKPAGRAPTGFMVGPVRIAVYYTSSSARVAIYLSRGKGILGDAQGDVLSSIEICIRFQKQ